MWSAFDANNRLRDNRALAEFKAPFEIHKFNQFKQKPRSKFRKYKFKKATPQYLSKLKAQLTSEKKRELTKRIVVLIISASLGIIIFL